MIVRWWFYCAHFLPFTIVHTLALISQRFSENKNDRKKLHKILFCVYICGANDGRPIKETHPTPMRVSRTRAFSKCVLLRGERSSGSNRNVKKKTPGRKSITKLWHSKVAQSNWPKNKGPLAEIQPKKKKEKCIKGSS